MIHRCWASLCVRQLHGKQRRAAQKLFFFLLFVILTNRPISPTASNLFWGFGEQIKHTLFDFYLLLYFVCITTSWMNIILPSIVSFPLVRFLPPPPSSSSSYLFDFLIIFLIYRCDGITSVPLLVPLTGWLPFPLPSQVNKHCTALTIHFLLFLPFSYHDFRWTWTFVPFHVVDFSLCFVSLRFVTFSFSISISLDSNNDCDRNRRDPFDCNGTV